MLRATITGLLLVTLALAPSSFAQQSPTSVSEIAEGVVSDFFNDSDTLNRQLKHLPSGRFLRLLEGMDFQFKTFSGNDSNQTSLGVEYDYSKSIMRSRKGQAWSLDFEAHGNVAFEEDINPDDFLSTGLSFRLFGKKALGNGDRSVLERGARNALEASQTPGDATFDANLFARATAHLAQKSSLEEIYQDELYMTASRNFVQGYVQQLPPELWWDLSGRVALESNQDFSSKQKVFGIQVGGVLKSWDPNSNLSRANIFDWAPAATRWLIGTTEGLEPSGTAWPVVLTGIDLVDASQDSGRDTLSNDDDFVRLRLEFGMKTLLAEIDSTPIYLSLGYRLYSEVDAPSAVRAADQDRFDHFQAVIQLPGNIDLTYATGRYPLDLDDGAIFALGYNISL